MGPDQIKRGAPNDRWAIRATDGAARDASR
jgi:hypothetical protein